MSTVTTYTAWEDNTRIRKDQGFVLTIKLIVDNTTLEIIPKINGFYHPAVRNPNFKGKNESSSKGKFLYYRIHEGWERDKVDSYAAAWLRTLDYQDSTKCLAHPNGILSKCKGF